MTFQKQTTTDVLINFVLDASGSMGHLRRATVEGFNQLIQDQVNQTEGEVRVSLTFFNSGFDVRYVAVPAAEIPLMGTSANPYNPGGGTALFDAIGVAVTGVEEWLRNNQSFDGKVLTVIWTDGEENSSRRHNQSSINELISTKQEQGWIFQFMGTGEEGWRTRQVFTAIPVANMGWNKPSEAGLFAGNVSISSSITSLRSTGGYAYDQSSTDRETAARS